MSEDFDTVVNALARMRGVSPETIKKEMLEKMMGLDAPAPPARAEQRLARVSGDASGVAVARTRAEAIERHAAEEFPGSPVVRYQDEDESPAEARERWYAEETHLRDGVHGLGGSTAGGIFGDGPIATNIYDPGSQSRGDAREGQMTNVAILGLVDRLTKRLDAQDAPRELPNAPRRTLSGAPRGRLGIGKK